MSLTRRAVLGGALASAGVGPAAAAREGSSPAIAPPRLRRGIGLWPCFSLTQEHPAPRTDYAWPPYQPQRPVPTAEDLRRLAEAGFDFVRLPVDPGPILAFIGPQREMLLGDVARAVDLCLAHGLAVVLNLQANTATHHYTPANLYGGTSAPLFPAFRDLVADLARRYAGRAPGRIVLEPVNEPPQACGALAWERVQEALLTAAREAAPRLPLVATGACGSGPTGLTALDPGPLRRRFAPLVFTFHFYEPFLFTHQGAPWMGEEIYRSLNRVPWPASQGSFDEVMAATRARMARDTLTPPARKPAVEALTTAKMREYFDADPGRWFIDKNLAPVQTWADLYGVPRAEILMGEFGALRSDDRYVASRAADRARYHRDVRQSAEAAGFAWSMWNLFDGLGLMDDAHRLDAGLLDALGLKVPRQ